MAGYAFTVAIALLACEAACVRTTLETENYTSACKAAHRISNECGKLARNYPETFGEDAVMAGSQVADYTLSRCMGAGGLGEVWLAEDATRQQVAMKFITMNPGGMGEDMSRTFTDECTFAKLASRHAEAGITACLAHGAVPIAWEGETVSFPYMASEMAAGTELERFLKQSPEVAKGPLASLEGVFTVMGRIHAIMAKLEHPVDHVQLYHDDLQPSNIMMTDEGEITTLDYGFNVICCDQFVDVEVCCHGYGMSCKLELSYFKQENDLVSKAVHPCKGPWADSTTKRDISKQSTYLAQNFVSMLVKFPEDVSGGLSVWWGYHLQREEQDRRFDYVFDRIRPAYRSKWTEECDDALSKALVPDQNPNQNNVQRLVDAFEAAHRSLGGGGAP